MNVPECIRLGWVNLVLTRLAPADYYRFTGDLCRQREFTSGYPFEVFIAEKRATESQIRIALGKRWTPLDEFEVGDDENLAFTLSGGVYSQRVLCREYFATLFGVIRSARSADSWSYETAVELNHPLDGMSICQFVLHGQTVVVNNDPQYFDYARYFNRSVDGR